nr:immunoglobulin heavy chain junction region [Macaca mulatta]
CARRFSGYGLESW